MNNKKLIRTIVFILCGTNIVLWGLKLNTYNDIINSVMYFLLMLYMIMDDYKEFKEIK